MRNSTSCESRLRVVICVVSGSAIIFSSAGATALILFSSSINLLLRFSFSSLSWWILMVSRLLFYF